MFDLTSLLPDPPDGELPDSVEWAEDTVVVPNSARPGRLAFDAWQRRPFRSMAGPTAVPSTTLCCGSQLGKTLQQAAAIGYKIRHDPCDMMVMFASEKHRKKWTKEKVSPILLATPELNRRIERSQRDTLPEDLWTHNGIYSITLALAGSRTDARGTSAGLVMGDELDDWPDPALVDSLLQRQITYDEGTTCFAGTPTRGSVEDSVMLRLFEAGTAEIWSVACPHCDWTGEMDRRGYTDGIYHCISCGAAWSREDRQMATQSADWLSTNPEADPDDRSFRIGCLAAPGISLAALWKVVRKTTLRHQMTQIHALAWQDLEDGELKPENVRRCILPFEPAFCTVGVDVQGDRIEWAVVAWTPDMTRGHVWQWGTAPRDDGGHCGLDMRHRIVDQIGHLAMGVTIDRRFRHDWVIRMINLAWPDLLFREDKEQFVEMCYGYADDRTVQDRPVRGAYVSENHGVRVATAEAKRALMADMAMGHFTIDVSLGDKAEEQLSSEVLVREVQNGRMKRRWVVKGGQRNELLDCCVYAMAGGVRVIQEYAKP